MVIAGLRMSPRSCPEFPSTGSWCHYLFCIHCLLYTALYLTLSFSRLAIYHKHQMLQSSNKYAATAGVLTEFLPVLDRLQALREQYDNDEFGAKYSALAGGLRAAFTEMGVTEYTVNEGEPVDKSRVVVVDSEYSETVEKDTVLRPVAIGMELQGNVVRMAECVASLGSETSSAEEEESGGGEEEPTPEEGDESTM